MCLRLLILTKTILLGGLNTVEAGTGPWCRKCVNSTDPQQNPLHIGLVFNFISTFKEHFRVEVKKKSIKSLLVMDVGDQMCW